VGAHLDYLWLLLNSTLLGYLFRYYIYSFDETGFKIFTDYFRNIPLPLPNQEGLIEAKQLLSDSIDIDLVNEWIYRMMKFTDTEIEEIENSVKRYLAGSNDFQ
jgi:hypothetical protein